MRHNVNENFENDKYGSEGYTTQSVKFIINKLYVLAISRYHCGYLTVNQCSGHSYCNAVARGSVSPASA